MAAALVCGGVGLGIAPSASAARLLGHVPRVLTGPAGGATPPAPLLQAQPHAATPFAAPTSSCAFTGCYQTLLNGFLSDVANAPTTSDVYGTTQQYGNGGPDPARSYQFAASADTITVHDPWPADAQRGNADGCQANPGPHDTSYGWCLTDQQVQAELSSVLGARGWPADMNSVYFVMLPPGIDECAGPFAELPGSNPCADTDFCAYHSNFSDAFGGPTPPLYAVLPWPDVSGCRTGQTPNGDVASDDGIDLISHEHIETVNDPLGNAWYAAANGAQDESADKCIKTYSNTGGQSYNQMINRHPYFLQDEFANHDPPGSAFNACQGKPGGAKDPVYLDAATGAAPLIYHGGPTMHTVHAYTIYWDGHPGANPTAAIASAPSTLHRDEVASFQAAPAPDPQGQAVSYTWTFGDGTSATGAAVSHAYAVSGSFPVTLTVADGGGYRASATQAVRVYAPPTASFTANPATAVAGASVDFNSAASADSDGRITNWSWSFGDNTSAKGPRVRHAYKRASAYRATLTLTDTNGSSASETLTVTALPRARPTLSTRGRPRTARWGSHVLLLTGSTLRCSNGPTACRVTLSVTTTRRLSARTAAGRRHAILRAITLGTASLGTRPGGSAALQLRLSAAGQALLGRIRRLPVSVHILVQVAGAPDTTRRLTATVTDPPRPRRH